jgi:NADH:ubiquinone oxidoreductase subunit
MSIGTRLYTLLRGELVGTDSFGNRYYRSKGKRLHGRERRWVLYKGEAEATKVPAEWSAWLHHTAPQPLMDRAAQAWPWQKDQHPNRTGTPEAYRPGGSQLRGGARAPTDSDYEPWVPE